MHTKQGCGVHRHRWGPNNSPVQGPSVGIGAVLRSHPEGLLRPREVRKEDPAFFFLLATTKTSRKGPCLKRSLQTPPPSFSNGFFVLRSKVFWPHYQLKHLKKNTCKHSELNISTPIWAMQEGLCGAEASPPRHCHLVVVCSLEHSGFKCLRLCDHSEWQRWGREVSGPQRHPPPRLLILE